MFKVIIPRSKDLTETNIRIGWANAFTWLGKKSVWLEDGKAPLDLWHEEVPDIVIIKQSELTESIVKAINKYGTIVFLFWECVEQYRSLTDKIKTTIFWFQDRLYKNSTGLNPLNSLPKVIYPAADTMRFKPGIYRKELAAELIYIGTWYPRKARLLKYLEQESKQRTVRIYGYGSWNHPLHVGAIESDELFADILKSGGQNIILYHDTPDSFNMNLEKLFKSEYCGACNVGFNSNEQGLPFVGHLNSGTYLDRVQEMLSCIN